MELRHLRYFVAVAEERSFTRAAQRLHLSQQSLSTAVQKLEAQLGCRLLDRTPQGVAVTPAGAALLSRAPAVFDAAEAATREAAGRPPVLELRLRYGLDSEAFVEPLLASFSGRSASVVVRAWTGMDADNALALRSGDVDAVFAWAQAPEGVQSMVVSVEQALLALPDRHRLAPLDRVPVAALADEPLVMFPRDGAPAVWDLLLNGLRPDGSAGAAVHELPVSGQGTMAEAVLRGLGVCPVSQTLAERVARPGLVLRPLDPPLHVPLLLAWREMTPALRPLVDELATGGP